MVSIFMTLLIAGRKTLDRVDSVLLTSGSA